METESRQEKLEKLRKFWKTHLDKWEESGLPQKEYCRQHNLIYHRFGLSYCQMLCMASGSVPFLFDPIYKFNPQDQLP
jgi:hypothetical protein